MRLKVGIGLAGFVASGRWDLPKMYRPMSLLKAFARNCDVKVDWLQPLGEWLHHRFHHKVRFTTLTRITYKPNTREFKSRVHTHKGAGLLAATLCFHQWHSIEGSFDGFDRLRCRVSKLTEVAKHIGTLNLVHVDSLNYLWRGGLNCG